MSHQMTEAEMKIFDTPQTSASRYPWDEWTSGKGFIIEKGKDFNGKPESMRYVLRAQATKRNLSVDIRTLDDGKIAFRFTKPSREDRREARQVITRITRNPGHPSW